MSDLSKNIAEARRNRGLTLRKLASKVELSAQYLCDIEQDRRVPPFRTIKKIADALGCTVMDLDPNIMVSIPYWIAEESGIELDPQWSE